jgi:hypothetical protein
MLSRSIRPASWMLRRIEPTKDGEERRFLDGFLRRLSLESTAVVEKSECPDFFVRFDGSARSVLIGCEVARFDAQTEGPTRVEHGHRWRAFATSLGEELRRAGLRTYGAVHLRTNSEDAFDAFLRDALRAALGKAAPS